jgi:hypothetical protein
MKRCPDCLRTYSNEKQKYCTHDGQLLEAVGDVNPRSSSIEPPTRITPAQPFDPYKTVIDRSPTFTPAVPTSELLTPEPPTSPLQGTSAAAIDASSTPDIVSAPAQPGLPLETVAIETRTPTYSTIPPPSQPSPPPPSTPLPLPPPPAGPPVQSASSPVTGLIDSTPVPAPAAQTAVTPKKSPRRLVLVIVLVLFLVVVGVIGAALVFILKPILVARMKNPTATNTPARRNPQSSPSPIASPASTLSSSPLSSPAATPSLNESDERSFVPPPNTNQFISSKERLDGNLVEHYFDFSFYYPKGWIRDQSAGGAGASNFAKVERRLPPDFTQENFAVGWYGSLGSEISDRQLYPTLVKKLSAQFQKTFPEYHKVSEGETRIGNYQGYEFRFEALSRHTAKGDLKIWGRTVFLPPLKDGPAGATLLMLATSLAPELKSVSDLGVKGELPIILESFRLGKKDQK